MKANIYTTLLCGAMLMLCFSCSNEKDIHAELEAPVYNVTDNSSDPVQHQRFQFYQDYKTYLITNPEVKDYRFNFQTKNNILMTAPTQSNDVLLGGVDMLKSLFLDVYSTDFKKKHLPFSIILADSIFYLGQDVGRPYYHSYASQRFLALGGIRREMATYSDSLKLAIKGDIHSRYWIDFLQGAKGVFSIPEEFEEISKSYYGKGVDYISDLGNVTGRLPWQIDYHQLGFITYNHNTTFYDEAEGAWWIEVPNADVDKRQWVAFFFNTPKSQRDALIAAYPKMKAKYDILKEAFLKCEGFDVDQLP